MAAQVDPAAALEQLINAGHVILTTKSALVVAITILFWDYVITFGMEVRSVWTQRFTWVTALFFINRYYWIAAAVMQGYLYWSPNIDSSLCHRLAPFESLGAIVPFLTISQLLLGIRVYALLNRHFFVLIVLTIYAGAQIGVGIWLTLKGDIAPIPPIGGDAFTICLQSSGANSSALIAIMLYMSIGMDTLIFVATAIRTLKAFMASETGLANTIFRDNLLYFAVVLCANTTAGVLTAKAPPEVFAVAGAIAASLNTVMASRVTMNLKNTALQHTVHSNRPPRPGATEEGSYTSVPSIIWTNPPYSTRLSHLNYQEPVDHLTSYNGPKAV